VRAPPVIEVVTEGIFSRQISDDHEMNGVAAVLLKEFRTTARC